MTDDTKAADTQQAQQPAGVGASPDPIGTAEDRNVFASKGAKGPRDWEEMKAWIRRELQLVGEGHTHEERAALNP